jgi:hypothetical protein
MSTANFQLTIKTSWMHRSDVSVVTLARPVFTKLPLDCEWKYSFARDIMSVILEKTVTAVPPTYETILDLDRLVREKSLPAHLNVFAGPEESGGPSKYMRHCFLGILRAIGTHSPTRTKRALRGSS